MELVYVWIEEYKNIKNQGFNFSPNHEFELIEENGEYRLEDKMTDKDRIPKEFFWQNISSITAIIGKNGSGKTNLLEIIASKISFVEPMNTNLEGIFILKKEGVLTCYVHKKLEKNFNKGNLNIRVFGNDGEYVSYPSAKIKVLFLANHLDMHHQKQRLQYGQINFVDLSLSCLLRNKFERTLDDIKSFNIINDFKKEIIYRQLQLISEFKGDYPLPKILRLEKNEDIINILYEKLIKSIKNNDIFYFRGNDSFEPPKNASDFKKELFIMLKEVKNRAEKMDITLERNYKNIYIEPNREYDKHMKNNKESLNSIYNFIYNFIWLLEEGINFIGANIDIQDKEKLEKLNKIFYTYKEKSWFSINYEPPLSTGEENLLFFYSQLHDYFKKCDTEEFIILIDELDNTMHPEWQRKSLNKLLKFLNNYFNEKKKIQIITTSHSPFMASDLTRENIIMLETYNENDKETELEENDDNYQKVGNCKIKNQKNLKTFGANIHELYKESFFMESTMGDFALSKIKEVIEDLTTLECIQRADRKLKKLEKKAEELKEKGEELPKTDKLEKDKLEESTSERVRKKGEIEEKKETIKYIIDRVGEKVIGRKLKEKYRGIFREEKSTEEKLNSKWNSLNEEEKVKLLSGKFGENNA
ncbi:MULTISPECIES: AAA family ATPase [Psychrilyobacter]|uniref:AAA family ATPase n=1 Tax=Psychrilyobacter piezotolerans TaxID=2293438 RepID=A0ABX9KFK9_9FUSO|nr:MULTISPECIES: AAA family ATPase [Psychrilyobacter]MCS5421389.1 ATP-binding protein [Psychrilyobacter sp. S5]NDI78475.1 AAA family ATPase [Psychrilyobacter piezotolerans]RDE60660.1 AAA family ATPase [Psychrilyobacter sp. S5]REI40587.1 AAA family ATPase [Psychrilyobacter piezotolerans]